MPMVMKYNYKSKDLSENQLEGCSSIFADIINVLLFKGEHRIDPKDLLAASEKSIFKADGEVHSQERDVAKYWEFDGFKIVMFGIENQTAYEDVMPLRVISYDGAEYSRQLREQNAIRRQNKKRRKEGLDPLPLQPLFPVITIVLYFGYESHWVEENMNLKNCFPIPEGLEDFVADYHINVFEVAWLTDEQIEMFQSDFKVVAHYFVQQRKLRDGLINEYKPLLTEIMHVEEILYLMSVFTGDRLFETVYNDFMNSLQEGGEISMDLIMTKVHERAYDKYRDSMAAFEKRTVNAETKLAELEKAHSDEIAALKKQLSEAAAAREKELSEAAAREKGLSEAAAAREKELSEAAAAREKELSEAAAREKKLETEITLLRAALAKKNG